MSIIRVGTIEGTSDTDYHIQMESTADIKVEGGLTVADRAQVTIPVGTEAQRPGTPAAGMIRVNTENDGAFEIYTGSGWAPVLTPPPPPETGGGGGGGGPEIGSNGNPATSGMALLAAGKTSGIYWVKPGSESAYEMYYNASDNGGGWILCARVRTNTCQDHVNNGAVRISGTTGPRTGDTSTSKMPDSWINALRTASTYTGPTAYWLEADGWGANMFVSSSATVDLVSSASNQNERTRVTTSYEGGLSDRGPNSGTRGFGDHHTSGNTYYAWARHPEQGNNCGFRSDARGASHGRLWVK